jgi:hypothetical protein
MYVFLGSGHTVYHFFHFTDTAEAAKSMQAGRQAMMSPTAPAVSTATEPPWLLVFALARSLLVKCGEELARKFCCMC